MKIIEWFQDPANLKASLIVSGIVGSILIAIVIFMVIMTSYVAQL